MTSRWAAEVPKTLGNSKFLLEEAASGPAAQAQDANIEKLGGASISKQQASQKQLDESRGPRSDAAEAGKH